VTVETLQQLIARVQGFDAIRDRVRAMGTDNMSHFGNGYTHEGGLSLQQNPDEFAALCIKLREWAPVAQYLEIGSASGGAAVALQTESLRFTKMLAIDDGGHHRFPEQKANFDKLHAIGVDVCFFHGDSHSTAAEQFLREHADGGTVDVAFIDGDHSHEGCWADLLLVTRFSRKGTVVVFHDTVACEGVHRAWHEGTRFFDQAAEYIGNGYRPLGIGVGVMR